jgi:hypothetical protein
VKPAGWCRQNLVKLPEEHPEMTGQGGWLVHQAVAGWRRLMQTGQSQPSAFTTGKKGDLLEDIITGEKKFRQIVTHFTRQHFGS